jgi:poly(3-hydroxyalkanoate) depolymerase
VGTQPRRGPVAAGDGSRGAVDVFDHIRVGRHRLHVCLRGSGRPLLVIGGVGANIQMSRPILHALTGVRTVAFEVPGSGRSSTPLRPRTMAGLASITEGMLDALGLGEVDVMGMSFGGGLAQQLARQAPSRVRRLVLLATSCGLGSIPGPPWAVGALATPLRYYSKSHFEALAPLFMGAKAKDKELVRDHARARRHSVPNPFGYYGQAFAALTWTSLPWLDRLTQPTLVISAKDDRIVPSVNGAILAARIPNARHHVVREGGHLFMLDAPDTVALLVLDFLAG